MDQLLQMLQSTDPSDDQPDLPELLHLEGKLCFPLTLHIKNNQRLYLVFCYRIVLYLKSIGNDIKNVNISTLP